MVFPVLVAPFPLMEMLSPETVMLVFPFSVAVALSVVVLPLAKLSATLLAVIALPVVVFPSI